MAVCKVCNQRVNVSKPANAINGKIYADGLVLCNKCDSEAAKLGESWKYSDLLRYIYVLARTHDMGLK